MINKKELRKEVRLLKKQYSDEQLKELSYSTIRKLLELSYVKEAKTIVLYCSLPDEVYTLDAIHALKDLGKKILLPAVTSETEMELREYNNDDDLRIGYFNILEPCGKPFFNYEEIDVAIIPGMGFDKTGNRLGRGKGYYDRFLSKAKDARKIGICFPFQLFEHIPTDIHDIKMDMVLS